MIERFKKELKCKRDGILEKFHHKYLAESPNASLQVSQQAFTCTKLTIEKLEQGVKYIERDVKYTNGVVLVSLLLTLNIFHILF